MHEHPYTDEAVPFRQRIGCTVREGCAATSLKATVLYGLMADGTIEYRKVGKRRVILVKSLLRLIEGDDVAKIGDRAEAA